MRSRFTCACTSIVQRLMVQRELETHAGDGETDGADDSLTVRILLEQEVLSAQS